MKSEDVYGLENAGWPALVLDSGGTVRGCNQSALVWFGAGVAKGSPPLYRLVAEEDAGKASKLLLTGGPDSIPVPSIRFRTKDGRLESRRAMVCTIGVNGSSRFLLQLLPEAAALLEQPGPADLGANAGLKHKLDCALQLARTVSLDFNNALTSILGHTSLFLAKTEADHPWRKLLVEVEKSAMRAAEISCELAAYSTQSRDKEDAVEGDLNQLVRRSVESFQKQPQPGAGAVRWELNLDSDLWASRFDERRLEQALAKIMENAIESFETDGTVSVSSRNLELNGPTQDRSAHLSPGAYVCCEIRDNGCGIEPEVLPRIFEPFFTTKKGAKHRGLGLAWVFGVLSNQGGGVAISSKPRDGTSVRIYLPAEKRIVNPGGGQGKELDGTATVLMVDDEELLLAMGQNILSSFGYKVLTAVSGHRALEILSQNKTQIDLLLTDLVMPVMSGRELVEQVLERWPATRILCTSGYYLPANQQPNAAFLQKPFTTQELLGKVKSALSVTA
jgi:signal transduction histidine kinase